MNRSPVKYFSLICLMAVGATSLFSQELKSNKVSFKVEPPPSEETQYFPDNSPPVIKIIHPNIRQGNYYKCQISELDLIGEITDESGIKFVTVNSDIRKLNEEGIFSTRVKLEPGINQLRLVAMDKSDNVKEQILLFDYQPPTVSLADRINGISTYYGLIIAIDEYNDYNLPKLDNPILDAERLYDVLTSKYTFNESNMTFLRNARREDIIKNLDMLSQKVTPNDNLLIYYAGHGWWDADAKNGYWLPSDAESSIKTNWFRNSTLVDYLKEIKSRHTLLIADACFGGSIFKTRSVMVKKDRAYERLYDLTSRKAMTSGTLTEVPDESSFAQYLVERLDENEAKYLTSEELFISFKLAVINNSNAVPKYGEISNVGDEGGDFIFLRKK